MSIVSPETGAITQKIFFNVPEGTRFFSQNPEEIQKILTYFQSLMENIQRQCEELGIIIVTREAGNCTLRGESIAIAMLVQALREKNILLESITRPNEVFYH